MAPPRPPFDPGLEPFATDYEWRIYRASYEHDTTAAAAQALGVSSSVVSSTCYRLRRKAERAGAAPAVVPAAPPDPAVLARAAPEIQRLRDQVSGLKAQLKEIARDNVDADEAREILVGVAGEALAPPDWTVDVTASGGHKRQAPVAMASDWHWGERVSAAETNGANEFSVAIAEARVRAFVDRVLDICLNHSTDPDYPGLVLALAGDLVSGELHPELEATDEVEVFPSILRVVEVLTWAVGLFADHFGRVFVPGVPGNHGRVFDRRPRAKRYAFRNADWLIYHLLMREFRADDRVTFMVPDSGEALFRVFDHRFMLVHGDDLGVRGGDGIIGALGPIVRGEIKVRTSSAEIGRDYDTMLMGHWHQPIWLERVIVSNALKGYDEYARRMLRAVPTAPSQALFFVHPDRGITSRWNVSVETAAPRPANEWVSIATQEAA